MRRLADVNLTKKGLKLVESAPSLLQDRFRERLNKMKEWERLMILTTRQRVASLMDAEEQDAAPHLVSGEMHPERASRDVSSRNCAASRRTGARGIRRRCV